MQASLGRRPPQVLVQERERALAVDAVAALEILDLCSIGQAELRVEELDLAVLVRDPLIAPDQIEMAALDHEWAREDQVGHLGIVEGVTPVPVRHLPLDRAHEAEGLISRGNL